MIKWIVSFIGRTTSIGCLGTVLLFSPGCGNRESANEQRFKVGTWKTAQTIQPFFYEQVAEYGVKVKVLPFTNPADQKTALLAGSLDMCGTTLAHAIHSASRGEPVVVVAALCNKCSALVVHQDSAIESIPELKGATIGYVPGTMHEILLRNLLRTNGLSVDDDVTLMRVDFFDMGTALANGNIDAFLSGEPFPSMAAAKGYGRILAYPYIEEGIGAVNAGMLVRRETIEKHPERVQALVGMHADATRYLREDPGRWLAYAARFGVESDVLEKARPNMELAWRMDNEFVTRARALGKNMLELGMIEREPDYDRLFDLQFVNRVGTEDDE